MAKPDAAEFEWFPGTGAVGAEALAAALTASLHRFREAGRHDPFLNPVELLALELSQQLASRRIDYAAVEQLIQYLTVEGFAARAERLGRYLGEVSPEANAARLRAVFLTLARPRTSDEISNDRAGTVRFELFKQRVERESFGIVITAHPTFNISTPLMRALAMLATDRTASGTTLSADERARLLDLARRAVHKPDPDLSLDREHHLSVEVIGNILKAVRDAYEILFDVAAELYPERYGDLVPRLITVASWVGYDLDGRSDILWTDTLHKRLVVQQRQLAYYHEEVQALRAAGKRRDLEGALDHLASRLATATDQAEHEIHTFARSENGGRPSPDMVREISRRIHDERDTRLTDSRPLVDLVTRAIACADDPAIARRLWVLRAELANHGLGMAHTHVRINATQVHNAIRKAVGMVTHPNDPRYRVSYLRKIDALLENVTPVRINFGSVMGERTSVKRLFMLVAQMLKHTDATTPIRFLIAECESAFTVLTALYYARMFGVERHIDISPLFETEKALEAGSRVVEQLLESPHYRAYVQARGRLCVQTGFSDAGRYLGQSPASASIERLRLRLVRIMAKHGLTDVQLVIFDTHGESIGRGGHPASFEQRLSYIDTPASRGFMAEHGISFKQEVSFQGGDGYLYFMNPVGAFAVVTRILEHASRHGDNSWDDPFYDEAAYVREFFTTVKEFQVGLMSDRDYGVLLSAFGANLFFPSGSRALKREHEEGGEIDYAQPSQLRAIPHNAILQQLGLLANSVSGVGAAIAKDPEKFRSLYARSSRMRQLLGIAEYGAAVSNPQVMQGYIRTLDPGYWIQRAAGERDRDRSDEMIRLADYLEPLNLAERQNKVFRRLHKDYALLERSLVAPGAVSPPGAAFGDASRARLDLLHAIRIAMIHEIFQLAMRIPEFSSRHALTPRQLVIRLLHLDVPPVVKRLEEIFPLAEDASTLGDFGEPADYRSDDSQSYQLENETIFRPIGDLFTLVRRTSAAITHRVGFFG